MKNLNEKSKYWLELSEYDFSCARVLLDGEKYLYVAFMCHQTIEKSLKSVIAKNKPSINMPKIHDLIVLAKIAKLYWGFSEEQKDLIDKLEPLNVQARYPSHKQKLMWTLTRRVCLEMIEETEELLLWIKSKL